MTVFRAAVVVAIAFVFAPTHHAFSQITVVYDTGQEPVAYAVDVFREVLTRTGQTSRTFPLHSAPKSAAIWIVTKDAIPGVLSHHIGTQDFEPIQAEGYAFRWIDGRQSLAVLSSDAIGARYGLLEIAEVMERDESFHTLPDKVVNPLFEYRIVKFNVPWSPYRVNRATEMHTHVVRDLDFWRRFLDMMVENRLNVLSLWNNHPFPFMIRAANFPEATPFNDQEMEEWQKFWRALFRMAKQRGIQTFVVNWNIVVSPEFVKAYGGREYNDLSEQVKQYTRESVTQVINEYEDLTGLGVTLADWMGTFNESMTPQQREDWIEETFIAGIKAANREVKFIHRSVLAGDPVAMRNLIDRANFAEPVLVEIKFNWSHGHSTPTLAITHDYHSGKLDERFWTPTPQNYRIQWMMRNEDFFMLRWGQPDFIRKHIQVNNHEYVNGYFIGSEGFIPALDYSQKESPIKTWQYAFEKQWLFYKVWGRLLYDPETPDAVFAGAFETRYGRGVGEPMLLAYRLASNMPLRLASFHRSTWDYTLYSEGFISAAPSSPTAQFDSASPFISIDQFIYHETLDPQLLSIPDYVSAVLAGKPVAGDMITPLALADSSEHDSRKALDLVASLRPRVHAYSGALISELDDIATWSYLGLYLADKLRAGVALEKYRKTGDTAQKQQAIAFLEKGLQHWDQVIHYTKDRYMPTPHVSTQRWGEVFQEFSWEQLRPQVARDIQIARDAVAEHTP
jgi:hypothetical protein